MANPHTFQDDFAVGTADPTRASDINRVAENTDYLKHEVAALATVLAGGATFSLDSPFELFISNTLTLSLAHWVSNDGRNWILGKLSVDGGSFTRGNADFYLMIGNITDAPNA